MKKLLNIYRDFKNSDPQALPIGITLSILFYLLYWVLLPIIY